MTGWKEPISFSRMRRVLLLFITIATLQVWDILRFASTCREYAAQEDRVISDPGQAQAIVVLTGDKNRIPKALELLHSRGSRFLIISGTHREVSLTELVNQQGRSAVNIHEVWKKIILESKSSSTVENAQESAAILTKNKIQTVILVTSEYHMERSLLIFKRVLPGMRYIAVPTPSEVSEIGWLFSHVSLTGMSKFLIEYWKLRVFQWFVLNQLVPVSTR